MEFQLIKRDRKRSKGTTSHLLLCAKTDPEGQSPRSSPPSLLLFLYFHRASMCTKENFVTKKKVGKERRGKEYTIRVCLIFTMLSQNMSNDEKITENLIEWNQLVTPPAPQITTFMIICWAGRSCQNSTLN